MVMVHKIEHEWVKVLYKDQNVPDNYVDKMFLTEMKKNVYVRKYKYWSVVFKTTSIANQFSSVTVLILLWWLLSEDWVLPNAVLSSLMICFVSCYLLTTLITKEKCVWGKLLNDAKTVLVVLSVTDYLSPILKTLTHTIDTDTVYTMCAFMIFGHLAFNHYGGSFAIISRAMSLNMAVFAAVCLASRLQSDRHVYVFIIAALVLFGLWPAFLSLINTKLGRRGEVAVCCVIVASTFVATFGIINMNVAGCYITTIIAVCFACPAILVNLQDKKDNIHGPWDEAVIHPQLKRRLSEEL